MESAKAAALRDLTAAGHPTADYVVLDQHTIETAKSWVFFYQHRRWINEGDPAHRLVGNLPLLVDKATGWVCHVPLVETTGSENEGRKMSRVGSAGTPARKMRGAQNETASVGFPSVGFPARVNSNLARKVL